MLILFLLFAVLPISEIMLLISVSDGIGGWNTFFLVLLTAFFGAYFVKREGLATLQTVQQKSAAGELPGKALSEGVLLLIAGVLLVTPGFITDGIGLLFTLPFSRAYIASSLVKHLLKQQQSGKNHFYFNMHRGSQFHQGSETNDYQHKSHRGYASSDENGDIIDGEYTDKTRSQDRNRIQ
ncbi:FxsA family protein [Agaribacter flavus]|uniref:FxsA family protein n=1 Tax=Agaribacter flavus TaxID=1902781 RepID=A0ABV7FQV4_9ALTE